MAPRTDRTTRIPSGVASPVTTNHAAKGAVFVNSRNDGNLKNVNAWQLARVGEVQTGRFRLSIAGEPKSRIPPLQTMQVRQGSGSRVQGAGCRVQGPVFSVQCSGFRVQGPGFRVQGPGFAVQGSRHVRRDFPFGVAALYNNLRTSIN